MKTRSHSPLAPMLRWITACAMWAVVIPATAQSQRNYPQQAPSYPQYNQPAPNYSQQPPPGYGANSYQQPTHYENPIEFLPKFGKRMSEMVRRLFYGRNSQPQNGYGQSGGYSLDSNPHQSYAPGYLRQPPPGYSQPSQRNYSAQPPQGYSSPSPQQPRYSYPPSQPPQQQASSSAKNNAPPTRSKSQSSSRHSYTPPKVASSSSKQSHTSSSKSRASKSTSKPPAPKEEPATESLPPTTTARRSESSPPRENHTASAGSSNFMKGRKTGKSGRVISPYPPYKELDVTGLDSGSLALDPTTQKIFEVP